MRLDWLQPKLLFPAKCRQSKSTKQNRRWTGLCCSSLKYNFKRIFSFRSTAHIPCGGCRARALGGMTHTAGQCCSGAGRKQGRSGWSGAAWFRPQTRAPACTYKGWKTIKSIGDDHIKSESNATLVMYFLSLHSIRFPFAKFQHYLVVKGGNIKWRQRIPPLKQVGPAHAKLGSHIPASKSKHYIAWGGKTAKHLLLRLLWRPNLVVSHAYERGLLVEQQQRAGRRATVGLG